jgi:hypothetical protein
MLERNSRLRLEAIIELSHKYELCDGSKKGCIRDIVTFYRDNRINLSVISFVDRKSVMETYQPPTIFKNGLTPITKVGIGLTVILTAVTLMMESKSPLSFMFLIIALVSYSASSEFRGGEITIRRGAISKIILAKNIIKIERGRWKLRLFYQENGETDSCVLPGGTTNQKQEEILGLIRQHCESFEVVEAKGILSEIS